ncbi:DUF6777 domain-containing protein [Streptomyces sp. NPDC002677]|uniref:DUF6777 domain-containing protein n=1 Tax=Streptomyces sp. NPDC002677 TaxID=3154774 RepID=UPI003316B0C2
MKRIRGSGRVTIALAAVLVVLGLLTTGCAAVVGEGAEAVGVQAVARGVPTLAPFFRKLGTDIAIGEAINLIAGEIGGDDPGLYGGTRDAGHCDKGRLVDFLEEPENRDKAEEWARAEGLKNVGEIGGFVAKLTPVLLRTDTLVKDHDFKKGRAQAFDALLEAGIAVLVDRLGQPVVQCSCGNPLASFKHDVEKADVKFDARNRKWPKYDPKKVAKVKPAAEDKPVEVYQLVDVEHPDAGLAREAGSDGTDDEVLPDGTGSDDTSGAPSDSATAETVTVPDVQGQPLADAQAALAAQGFQVSTTDEVTDTATPGTVIGQNPEAGTGVPGGSLVTLTVAGDGTGTGEPTTTGPTGDDGGGDSSGADGGAAVDGGPGEGGTDAGASVSGGLFGGVAEGAFRG